MRKLLILPAIANVIVAASCLADQPIDLIHDAATRIDVSKDIVVAQCTKAGKGHKYPGSANVVISDFDVLKVLKGTRKKGHLRVAQPWPPKSNTRYLLFNGGGATGDSTFLIGLSALEKVEIPTHFDLRALDGKPLEAQVISLIKARKRQVDREIKNLWREQKALERGLREENPMDSTEAPDDSVQ